MNEEVEPLFDKERLKLVGPDVLDRHVLEGGDFIDVAGCGIFGVNFEFVAWPGIL